MVEGKIGRIFYHKWDGEQIYKTSLIKPSEKKHSQIWIFSRINYPSPFPILLENHTKSNFL